MFLLEEKKDRKAGCVSQFGSQAREVNYGFKSEEMSNPLLLEVIDNGARSVGIGTGVFRICTNQMVVLCFLAWHSLYLFGL